MVRALSYSVCGSPTKTQGSSQGKKVAPCVHDSLWLELVCVGGWRGGGGAVGIKNKSKS